MDHGLNTQGGHNVVKVMSLLILMCFCMEKCLLNELAAYFLLHVNLVSWHIGYWWGELLVIVHEAMTDMPNWLPFRFPFMKPPVLFLHIWVIHTQVGLVNERPTATEI